ncbi:hypothetical protein CJA_1388 [Cellvibrio japonicus Ueda107]|uniref:Uncharacterized protein n=1 Tax=Cellvibrio japonicus (strain Ueda107) TaxID=498211 RepID=B3PD23_CELJU|nr:hypothetical protein CJA_1388 [Cellvibrio japonicus Ueda107]
MLKVYRNSEWQHSIVNVNLQGITIYGEKIACQT